MKRFDRLFNPPLLFIALLTVALLAGCGGSGKPAVAPTVVSSSPSDGATNVPTSTINSNNVVTGTIVIATFSQPMNPATIDSSSAGALLTFTLKETTTGSSVPGTVAMDAANTVATFTPSASALNTNTNFTATVTVAAKNAGGTALAAPVAWSFTTNAALSSGQAPVSLGTAGTFAILTKTGITDVPTSAINGDVGSSPITGAAIQLTCAEVLTGKIYSVDAAGPLPCRITDSTLLTAAIGDMQTAYTDAAGRVLPDFTELGAGNIGGLTLVPGLYKWGNDVSILTDLTLSGGPNDVWIFQIGGKLTLANATKVILIGGALPKNIFWQSAGSVAIGTTADFEGVLLGKTDIAVNTKASVNGRLFAQSAVTLQQNAVTQPVQ
jgi:hypothetical protein